MARDKIRYTHKHIPQKQKVEEELILENSPKLRILILETSELGRFWKLQNWIDSESFEIF